MKHLSGLDATFLYLETPEMPMHVGGLNLIDLPGGYDGDFYEDVKAHIAGRMHLAPVFQRKLAPMPFELANPVWVDDDDVDLEYHIRRIMLPKPGTMAQLETYVGRLHSSLLDRSRPLWEFSVIEGLQSGQVAFYTKVHHAAVDGQAGVALANAILDLSPARRAVKAPHSRKRGNAYQLGVAELIGAALRNTLLQYVKLAKLLPGAVRAAAGTLARRRAGAASGGNRWSLGPRTPINVAITNQRSFATLSTPLAETKAMAKRFEVSLNDIVLAVCAGALKRYLADAGCVPSKPLVAAVPVSLREAGDASSNNQASMMLCNLATTIVDPVARLREIHASTASAKATMGAFKAVIPTDFPSFGAPWLMSGLASLYGRSRLANRIAPVANVVISNVPGPQVPLYLAGALLKTYYPVSIVVHGVALNITVESFNGSLDYGLTACRKALPDVRDLAAYMREAHEELKRLAAALPVEASATEAQVKASASKPPRKRARKVKPLMKRERKGAAAAAQVH